MKKLLAILLIFTCALSFTSCLDGLGEIADMLEQWGSESATTTTDWSDMTVTTTTLSINPEKTPLQSHAHGESLELVPEFVEFNFYLPLTKEHLAAANNADMLTSKTPLHCPLFLINSTEDIESFASFFRVPEDEEPFYYDFSSLITDRLNYDDEFFENNSLILIFADEGSSTPKLGINGLYACGETLFVCVSSVSGEVMSDDYTLRYLAIPVEKELVSQFTEFDADLEHIIVEYKK